MSVVELKKFLEYHKKISDLLSKIHEPVKNLREHLISVYRDTDSVWNIAASEEVAQLNEPLDQWETASKIFSEFSEIENAQHLIEGRPIALGRFFSCAYQLFASLDHHWSEDPQGRIWLAPDTWEKTACSNLAQRIMIAVSLSSFLIPDGNFLGCFGWDYDEMATCWNKLTHEVSLA